MTPALDPLIAALREELSQYGEMLALLDRQQNLVLDRNTAELLETTAAVGAQSQVVQTTRQEREQRQRELTRSLGLADGFPLRQLVSQLPADYRPLVEALVEENNALLVRVQQRARQNLVLLGRAIDLSQRLVDSLCHGHQAVYTEAGGLRAGAPAWAGLYQAVG